MCNIAGDQIDKYMLDAMLQSGRKNTPVLVVNVLSSEGDMDMHAPVVVADKLHMCKFSNHPWQVC